MEHIPKNIRQIGGNEERVKIYMEDYVSTYLRRVAETQEENGVSGFLVGNWQQEGSVPCAFVGGAMAVSQVTMEGGQVCFSSEAWNEGYRSLGTYFSGEELCGLFVCEGSCRRFRKQALFAAVRECFPDQQAVLYLLTEEGEEVVYRILPRGEERLQGYYCYFERNEAMQDYMVDHLPERRVEREISQNGWRQNVQTGHEKEGSLGQPMDPVFSFRRKMDRKNGMSAQKRKATGRGIPAVCAVMALVIVLSGMGLAYRGRSGVQIGDILSRLHIDPQMLAAVSVLPQETGEHYVGREMNQNQEDREEELSAGILVEEVPGNVFPTEDEEAETSEPESMESETAEPEHTEQETTQPEVTQPEATKPETTEAALSVGTGVLYTVKEGDSLYSISRRFYGTEEMAVVIQQMNHLENADLIKVGQELQLP